MKISLIPALILQLFLSSSICFPISYAKKTLDGFDSSIALTSLFSVLSTRTSFVNKHSCNNVSYSPSLSILLPDAKTEFEFNMLILNNPIIYLKEANLLFLQPYWLKQNMHFCIALGLNLRWIEINSQKAQTLGPTLLNRFEYLILEHTSFSSETSTTLNRVRLKLKNQSLYYIKPTIDEELCINYAKHSPSFHSFIKASLGYKFAQSPLTYQHSLILKLSCSL